MKNVIIAVLAVALIMVVVFCYQGGLGITSQRWPSGKKNNLENVDCKKNGAVGNGHTGEAAIDVNDSDPIVSKSDEGVFVCKGEVVYWQPKGSNIKSIDVHFEQADWPFDSTYQSHIQADNGNSTSALTVDKAPAGYRMKPGKYTITVTTKNGATLQALDPHVIPMGP